MERGVYINDKFISEEELISEIKKFFKENIIKNHVKNTEKLKKISEFKINPFLSKYLANFLTGNTSSKSIAKSLVYPRVLGTSITTSFGTQMQQFVNKVLGSTGSLATGIDIEFIDHIDKRKKYCQIKSGPTTINKDDVITISNHFRNMKNLGRTNGISIANTDCIVGVLYGDYDDLSQFYKELNHDYVVLAGQSFWYHLTGSEDFYDIMTDAIAEISDEYDGREILDYVIDNLATQIEKEVWFKTDSNN